MRKFISALGLVIIPVFISLCLSSNITDHTVTEGSENSTKNTQATTVATTQAQETTQPTTVDATEPTKKVLKISKVPQKETQPDYTDVEEAELTENSVSQLSLISSNEWIEYANPNSGYHPKLIDMGTKWNGYRFWISYTPYPSGNDYYENPHIVGSNDLITFSDVKYAVDPPYDAKNSVRYNSDSHILYNYNKDQLELYWRYLDTDSSYMCLYRVTSSNGIDWSEREIFLETHNVKKYDIVSPAIVYDEGVYKMWFVRDYKIWYQEYNDSGLTDPVKTQIKFENDNLPWHLDVIKGPNGYELLACATHSKQDRKHMNLYYATSEDGLKWGDAKVVLTPSSNEYNWDGGGLYRATFTYSYTDGMYYVLYGARNDHSVFGTGLLFGKSMDKLYGTDLDYTNPDENTSKSLWKTINKLKLS